MACCVVVRRGVACNVGAPEFVDVAVAVDTHVIRDVNPSLLVLVVPLILAQSAWGIAVVAEDHGLVMEDHPGDGVALASGPGRPRAPGVSAYQQCRSGSGQAGAGLRRRGTRARADH